MPAMGKVTIASHETFFSVCQAQPCLVQCKCALSGAHFLAPMSDPLVSPPPPPPPYLLCMCEVSMQLHLLLWYLLLCITCFFILHSYFLVGALTFFIIPYNSPFSVGILTRYLLPLFIVIGGCTSSAVTLQLLCGLSYRLMSHHCHHHHHHRPWRTSYWGQAKCRKHCHVINCHSFLHLHYLLGNWFLFFCFAATENLPSLYIMFTPLIKCGCINISFVHKNH